MSFQVIEILPEGIIGVDFNLDFSSNQRDQRMQTNPDAIFFLNVSQVSGSAPNMEIQIRARFDASPNPPITVLGVFAGIGATTQEFITITNCPEALELVVTTSGSGQVFVAELTMTRA